MHEVAAKPVAGAALTALTGRAEPSRAEPSRRAVQATLLVTISCADRVLETNFACVRSHRARQRSTRDTHLLYFFG